MKLAAVNPQLGLNIEGLLSKDVCSRFITPGSSSLLSFQFVFARNVHQNYKTRSVSFDDMQLIRYPSAPSSAPIGFSVAQSGMVQEGVHSVASSNGFRTVMQDQLNERDSFREHVSQVCKAEHQYFFFLFVFLLKLEHLYFHIP